LGFWHESWRHWTAPNLAKDPYFSHFLPVVRAFHPMTENFADSLSARLIFARRLPFGKIVE
jgi:hypothetical protein